MFPNWSLAHKFVYTDYGSSTCSDNYVRQRVFSTYLTISKFKAFRALGLFNVIIPTFWVSSRTIELDAVDDIILPIEGIDERDDANRLN